MIAELLSLWLTSWGRPAPEHGLLAAANAVVRQATDLSRPLAPKFLPASRAVSNWRYEAAQGLGVAPDALARILATDAPASPRCIRLNNYWCVKRAGWSGEIASDSEGHVAFASAAEGAAVAAILLRRYYLVYNLRSAQAIVSRWAPATCGAGASTAKRDSAARLAAIAPRGIGNTLRARWLAAHRPGKAPRAGKGAPKLRMSIVIDRKTRMIEAPEIAVGMGESGPAARSAARVGIRLASLETPGLLLPLAPPPPPAPSCAGESVRIRQYALRAVEGLAVGPDDDLDLFAADGTPRPNLALVMNNMAKVEIGPHAASQGLIRAAVEAAALRAGSAAAR